MFSLSIHARLIILYVEFQRVLQSIIGQRNFLLLIFAKFSNSSKILADFRINLTNFLNFLIGSFITSNPVVTIILRT